MAEGTTPNGTDWTTFSASVDGAGTVRWGVSDEAYGNADIPTILYAHGSGGGSNQFESLNAWSELRNWLLDNGYAWIESTGGGAKSWGNQSARDAYEAAYLHVSSIMNLGAVVPLGRSMGGVVASWLYTSSEVIEPVSVGCIINSGVQSLVNWYEAGIDRPAVMAAFSASNESEFYTNVLGFEPLQFAPSLFSGKRLLQLVGTSDTTVPPVQHGYAMRSVYAGEPEVDLLDVKLGGDHSATNGSYTQVVPMTNFLVSVTGRGVPIPEPTPPTSDVFIVTSRRIMLEDGLLHVITKRP